MSLLGHSRLGGASCRSTHVRNAPLATVGLKKAACRDGPVTEVAGLIGNDKVLVRQPL
jgi:hypothetical protein